MKTLLYIALIAFSTSVIQAQQGTVKVEQDKKIDELLTIYKSYNENIEYYRIQVGFGSYAKAESIKSNVEIDFPGMYSKIDFESPNYKVRLGKFKTKFDGERKLIEVRKKYPEAMLLKPKKST